MLQHFPSVHGALHKNRAGGNTLPEHKGAAQRGKQRDDVANTRRSNKRLPKAASKASARLVNATFRLILSFDQVTPGSLFQVCPKKEKLGPRLLETTWSREARRSGLGLGLEPPAVRRPRLLPGDNLEQGGEAKRTRTRTSRCPLTCLAPYRWTKPARETSRGSHTSTHTPSIAFRHLPRNSAKFGYATEGVLGLYLYLRAAVHRCCHRPPKGLGSNNYDCGSSLAPKHARKHETHSPRVKKRKKKKKKRVPS